MTIIHDADTIRAAKRIRLGFQESESIWRDASAESFQLLQGELLEVRQDLRDDYHELTRKVLDAEEEAEEEQQEEEVPQEQQQPNQQQQDKEKPQEQQHEAEGQGAGQAGVKWGDKSVNFRGRNKTDSK